MPLHDDDPVIAVATAPGQGGIGVVRISGGRDADGSAAALDWLVRAIVGRAPAPRHAHYGAFLDAAGQPIDRGIALLFAAPHSYTGEHVLELQAHGGPVLLRMLVARCLDIARAAGVPLRLAEPGEFTRRAFLNDKLDLAQAEAVADLISAQTEAAARGAAASLDGRFSADIHALVERLTNLRLLVEATLDFPEEEIDFLQASDALGQLARVEAELDALLARARHGALLRDGLRVVLAGVPNAGKSSLLNALAGAEVAIVTPVAGTTRDRVEQTLAIDGIPLVIVDTAGLRATEDAVEAIGIERSWAAIERADLVLHVHDLTTADVAENAVIAARFPAGVPVLRVFNKVDLAGAPTEPGAADAVFISARQGLGLDELRARVLAAVGVPQAQEGTITARSRHLEALRAAREHLAQARANVTGGDGVAGSHAPPLDDAHLDLFAEELRLAQEALASITGAFTADDLLGKIFSAFCIGK
ncbi:tRNA uridine-5-carboxymethylaminomethyl(34) synthesis GTPase MnmE [Derxia lacustris]|uniref:tRNA uridine-5-carboxymethylaminomethyl(34) synthesis GTPase MnmE n=1 Tax=Derxia lacustris TaxID=764842 RepID=UPI000A17280D|nr:tRNA uridine-5-carboxymethylaminomethyl(34) synthesis GTPase MnmE [Derxia lacustris]